MLTSQEFNALTFSSAMYREAEKHRGSIGGRVYRGTCHTLSAFMEDLFAEFLDILLGDKIDMVLVDVSMMIGRTHCRPDIVLIQGKEILGIFDCKTSLGWHRDGVKTMAMHYASLRQDIDKCDGKVEINGVHDDVNGSYSVPKDVVWDIFINSVWGQGKTGTVLSQINDWNACGEYGRTRIHWIKYQDYDGKKWVINEDAFEKILGRISESTSKYLPTHA